MIKGDVVSGPRLHDRFFQVQEAQNKLSRYLLELAKEYDLTPVEEACILNEVQASCLKYAKREERHPEDPNKKGDEE